MMPFRQRRLHAVRVGMELKTGLKTTVSFNSLELLFDHSNQQQRYELPQVRDGIPQQGRILVITYSQTYSHIWDNVRSAHLPIAWYLQHNKPFKIQEFELGKYRPYRF